jgi:hypothetical protein
MVLDGISPKDLTQAVQIERYVEAALRSFSRVVATDAS